MDTRYLKELFISCLEKNYTQTENGGSFAALRDGDLLYIFFEESNGIEDWGNNLSYRPAEKEGKFYHEGFLRVFESILPYIDPLIKNESVESICIVGYSHGGALALLCHEYIYNTRPDIREDLFTYAYGAPRVRRSSDAIDREIFANALRIVNSGDPVTHLPPQFFGYRHVGEEYLIGEAGKYRGVDAHRAENYIKELELKENFEKML